MTSIEMFGSSTTSSIRLVVGTSLYLKEEELMERILGAILVAVCSTVGLPRTAEAQENKKEQPCTAAEYSQFDFWVGEWRVSDEAGTYQGTNRVEKILNGCSVQENWTGASGMRGHSYNMYAKRRGIWHQTWVDSNGMLLLLDGGLEDGRMVLRGQTPAMQGKGAVSHEISWEALSDGRVRQVWRVSNDGGSNWSNAFVGLYTRKTE
jgi:hypothetical protein